MLELLLATIFFLAGSREIVIAAPAPRVEIIEGAILTAYSSSEDETDSSPKITASNQEVHEGVVANNCLPFGTRLAWEGKTYVVKDRKNKRYGCEWFDIWHPSKESALEFGIKRNEQLIKL